MRKIIFLLCVIVLIVSCTPTEKKCVVDDDCVPSSCCHAIDTINKEHSPDCQSTLCTLDCKPGTLDCGQGEIKCVENECTAILG